MTITELHHTIELMIEKDKHTPRALACRLLHLIIDERDAARREGFNLAIDNFVKAARCRYGERSGL